MMKATILFILSLVACVVFAGPTFKFPTGFKFGTATAAYQVCVLLMHLGAKPPNFRKTSEFLNTANRYFTASL